MDEEVCEICDANPKQDPDGKWCESCEIEFKESDSE